MIAFEELGLHLAQDSYRRNPGAIPAPTEWGNVQRVQVKASANMVW